MKKSAIALWCATALSLFAASSNAAEFSNTDTYRIEVCTLPLADIVNTIPFVKALIAQLKLQHMFVRGIEGTEVSGLNFEPENPEGFLGSKSRIGKQNYVNATCAVLFSSNNKEDYDLQWARFVAEYDEALEHPYSVYAKNCQVVTQEVLKNLEYEMPMAIQAVFDQQGIKVQNNEVNCAQQ